MPWRDAVIERAVALAASVGVGVGNIEGVRTDLGRSWGWVRAVFQLAWDRC